MRPSSLRGWLLAIQEAAAESPRLEQSVSRARSTGRSAASTVLRGRAGLGSHILALVRRQLAAALDGLARCALRRRSRGTCGDGRPRWVSDHELCTEMHTPAGGSYLTKRLKINGLAFSPRFHHGSPEGESRTVHRVSDPPLVRDVAAARRRRPRGHSGSERPHRPDEDDNLRRPGARQTARRHPAPACPDQNAGDEVMTPRLGRARAAGVRRVVTEGLVDMGDTGDPGHAAGLPAAAVWRVRGRRGRLSRSRSRAGVRSAPTKWTRAGVSSS